MTILLVFQITNAFLLVLMMYKILKVYPILPQKIPTTFDFQMKADTYGTKKIIFLFPVISILISVFMYFPIESYNYPVPITPENQEIQRQIADLAVAIISFLCTLLLYLCTLLVIYYQDEDKKRQIVYLFWNLLVLIVLAPIVFLIISYQYKG